jgi:hypothetical protein
MIYLLTCRALQISSARSALNWLLVQAHSLQRIGQPGSQVGIAKLSTRDAPVALAMERGIAAGKKKRMHVVKQVSPSPSAPRAKRFRGLEEEGAEEDEGVTQTDPLRGKIRTCIPSENLDRAMKWFLMGQVCEEAVTELGSSRPQPTRDQQAHYMRVQGRLLTLLELWALARGEDCRGSDQHQVAVAKLFGEYAPTDVVGPDRMYKMQILMDEAKHNKTAKNELIGATRHRDPLRCAVNAAATALLLRFGTCGVLGKLPDFFDVNCNWPDEHHLFTESDGHSPLRYNTHVSLFADMKAAAGLMMVMGSCATKLRSFGAMHASDYQAPHEDIEKMGR